MKTFKSNLAVEILEKVKRAAFYVQLTFVCLMLPALFLIGIKGNDHKNPQPSGYERMYSNQADANSIVNFSKILSDQNS